MTFDRLSLLAAVNACLPGIDSKLTLIEGTDSIVFTGKAVHSYNDHIAVSVPFDSSLHGAIKAAEFHKLLSKISSDTLTIEVADTEWQISAGKIKAKLKMIDSKIIKYLEALNVEELAWTEIDGAEFVDALALCKIAANTTPFKGVFVKDRDVLSTDSVRINHYTMGTEMSQAFWIEDSACAEISKFKNLTHYAVKSDWVHFKGEDGTVFSVRSRDVSGFPHAKLIEIIDKTKEEDNTIKGTLPIALLEAIDRSAIFGQEAKGITVVQLQISQNSLLIKADRNIGEYEESLDFAEPLSAAVAIELWVDAAFLKEAAIKVQNFDIKNADTLPVILFSNDQYTQLTHTMKLGN